MLLKPLARQGTVWITIIEALRQEHRIDIGQPRTPDDGKTKPTLAPAIHRHWLLRLRMPDRPTSDTWRTSGLGTRCPCPVRLGVVRALLL